MNTSTALAAATLSGPSAVSVNLEHDLDKRPANADEALRVLLRGNQRFVSAQQLRPHQTPQHRLGVTRAQHPSAVIITCADSRVSPVLIFDHGLGDLFVLRVAGNIVDTSVLASIEYAVVELGAPLVMVLGHEHCGAVKATLNVLDNQLTLPGHLNVIVNSIRPAVQHIHAGSDEQRLHKAVEANARMVARQIQDCEPLLTQRVREGKLRVCSAIYDLTTGKVNLLSEDQPRMNYGASRSTSTLRQSWSFQSHQSKIMYQPLRLYSYGHRQ
jgi:carbonic anhydrase